MKHTRLKELLVHKAEKCSRYNPAKAAVEGVANFLELGREERVAAFAQKNENYAPERVIMLKDETKFSDYEKSALTLS
ncbi:hypothetical protein [Bartonella tribocorum]|uniref:hypothetical protein n=1 Tax=Bartonella tribocorum TaxID=85701 RepID=UPI001FDA81E2|nr:hypothetical protein [Bartonella tribocorum]